MSTKRYAVLVMLLGGGFLCELAVTPPARGQSMTNAEPQVVLSEALQGLRSSLDSAMRESPIPGAAVAVATADSVVFVWTSGVTDKVSGEPVTEQTLFCIGSCTKTFTGLGLLKLATEGKIDLNAPVQQVAPEIAIQNPWANTDPVRVIHLLEHSAGFDDSRIAWFYVDGPPKSLESSLAEREDLRHVRWKPGTRFSYSSPGYTLAGYILQRASGQPFESYLQQEILAPIGMRDSRIGNATDGEESLATGFDRNIEPFPSYYDHEVPAGRMKSSIRDMAVFLQFMLKRGQLNGRRFVSDSLFDQIARPQSTLAARCGLKLGYSFGVGTVYQHGAIWHGHSGGVPGFLADYRYCPNRGIGFVMLQNQFDIMLHTDIYDVVRAALMPLADSITPPAAAAVSVDRLNSYCGYYDSGNPRMRIMGLIETLTGGINVLYDGDSLFTQGFAEERVPLVAVAEMRFRRPWDPEATFAFGRDRDGTPVLVSQSAYYEKSAGWRPWVRRILVFGALGIMLSTIIYAVIWIPVHLFKTLRRVGRRTKCLSMRVVPLLAVVSLVAGTWSVGHQTMLELGLPTLPNIAFFLSTLIFAGLSLLSIATTYRSFFMSVHAVARAYALLVSISTLGIALYLGYWGVIGLRLWKF